MTGDSAADVLDFWRTAGPQRWFKKDPEFDAGFCKRFLAAHEAAAQGELQHWADDADGALTEALGAEPHRFAVLHRDIIEKFGRFPHRNRLLGRTTLPPEQRFLDQGGFAG